LLEVLLKVDARMVFYLVLSIEVDTTVEKEKVEM
jgi:hypothetical protein